MEKIPRNMIVLMRALTCKRELSALFAYVPQKDGTLMWVNMLMMIFIFLE